MKSAYYVTPRNLGVLLSPRQSENKKRSSLPVYSFTWIDIIVVFVSIGTYLADIITDVLVTLVYWKLDEKTWAILTLLFLLVPSVVMQIFSARWYLADGHKPSLSLVLTHTFMMGPIKRYIAVLDHGIRARKTKRIEDYQAMYSELSDVSMLRLFESFLESAPQLVLQLYIMIKVTEEDHILTGIAACFSLISLSWAIAAYTKALRTAAFSQDGRKKRVSYSGLALQTFWRVGMVAGRIIALVLCATVYPIWVSVGVGVHWIMMTLWLVIQDTDFCATWWEERLFNAVVGVIHIFCFFNMKEGRSRGRMIAFYAITFMENTAMILLWYPHRTVGVWYNIPAMTAVWGGFFIGMLAMVLYYRYFHPSSPKKCHCCMLYYHMLYKCCPCQDVTLLQGSPYRRRVNVDETSSEFEYGNLNFRREREALRDIEEDHVENYNSLNSNDRRFILSHPQLTSTPGNDLDYKIKYDGPSLEYLEECERDDTTPTSHSNDFINAGKAASSHDDIVTMTPLALKNLPGAHTGPCTNKGNSTLVREWVKTAQDIYGPNEDTASSANTAKAVSDFGTLRYATQDEREFMQMHFGNFDGRPSGRRDISRLKSFSKKDRQQPTVVRKPLKVASSKPSLRNTFREAFGFHTFETDEVVKTVSARKIIVEQPMQSQRNENKMWGVVDVDARVKEKHLDFEIPSKNTEALDPTYFNKISARIDQPPGYIPGISHYKQRTGKFISQKKIKRELRSSKSSKKITKLRNDNSEGRLVNEATARLKSSQYGASVTMQPDREIEPYDGTAFENSDQNTVIVVDETKQKTSNDFNTDIGNIAHMDFAQPNHSPTKANAYECEIQIGSESLLTQSSEHSETNTKDLNEKRISKLCSEYFGPVIQVKGQTVTVKHRDTTPLQLVATEPSHQNLAQKSDTDPIDPALDNKLGNNSQPSSPQHCDEDILVMKSECENLVSTKVFKPSRIRSNIVKTVAASSACEQACLNRSTQSNKKRTSRKLPEDSNARKKLSFMKSSKSYNLHDSRKKPRDITGTFLIRGSPGEIENSPAIANRLKDVPSLSSSMERMLDGEVNYKVHLRDPVGDKTSKNTTRNNKRKALGSIENQ